MAGFGGSVGGAGCGDALSVLGGGVVVGGACARAAVSSLQVKTKNPVKIPPRR